MDLLEYQVKEWFSNIGIPVLPSQRIDHPTDLKRLKISYPIVLKSQVYAGERAKAGGVRFVGTTIDAIASAQTLFNLPIGRELPEVLLAESQYIGEQELYLAVVLDTAVCRPVLLGCTEADVDWEAAGEKMHHVVVEQEFSPFYARRLALKMGLQGKLMQSVSSVVEKMYQLFVQQDLDLVEINPLAVSASGEVMALNGKVSINERAIGRHPDLAEIAVKIAHRQSGSSTRHLGNWDSLDLHGKIGILGNGMGSMMATLDLVTSVGGKAGSCLNLRHAFVTDVSPRTFSDRFERGFADRLAKGLNILAADKSIQVILLNLLGSVPQTEEVYAIIRNFVQPEHPDTKSTTVRGSSRTSRDNHFPQLVVRIAGSEFNIAQNCLATINTETDALIVVENLDEAVAASVRLAKLTAHKKV
ncbi:ATP-grasp domain-containing protein [Nodularia harveyana UHCC-0300]|uniref:ATP-grasp domain-containing protein n=1 Tax=Nodularia harveyana UHCC-0300 TaxID=2974287 RepID=A0ABU5UD61_9CYAN|nr:ATP-grasp domain-containing protein [Nodularia harveyana]MEA5581055.1 ATP-grasp domain-containing protein [Nodularia harveyana UHCC-0300]